MTSPTERIAEVLRAALGEQADVEPYGDGTVDITGPVDLAEVAEQIAAELQLTEEFAVADPDGDSELIIIQDTRGSHEHARRHKYFDRLQIVSHWVSAWAAVKEKQ